MTLVTASCASSQASATCATDAPCASAMGRMTSRMSNARSLSSGAESRTRRAARRGPARTSRVNFPDRKPPARGLQTSRPSPWSRIERDRVALDVASRQRVVGLRALEALEAPPLRYAQRLHQLPGLEVRAADVAHLARADQVGQRAQRLVDGGLGVGAVDLVEVDAVGAEPLQARLAGLDDVQPGEAHLVRARTQCGRAPWSR